MCNYGNTEMLILHIKKNSAANFQIHNAHYNSSVLGRRTFSNLFPIND